MGILKWFFDKIGGPDTVCESLYKAYLRSINSGNDHIQSLNYCLESRYSIIKTIPKEQFDLILMECTDLGSLAFTCIVRENPLRGGDNFAVTMSKIINFFDKYDPHQADGLRNFITTLTNYRKAANTFNNDEAFIIAYDVSIKNHVLKSLLFSNMKYINTETEKKNSSWHEISSLVDTLEGQYFSKY